MITELDKVQQNLLKLRSILKDVFLSFLFASSQTFFPIDFDLTTAINLMHSLVCYLRTCSFLLAAATAIDATKWQWAEKKSDTKISIRGGVKIFLLSNFSFSKIVAQETLFFDFHLWINIVDNLITYTMHRAASIIKKRERTNYN